MPGLLTVGSALGKALFSGVQGYFQRRQEMKQAEQDHRFELERLEKTAQLQKELGSIRLEETQTESEAQVLTAAIQAEAEEGVARQKAYIAEGKGVSQWVNNLRGATRPGLTWLLVAAVVAMAAWEPDTRKDLIPVIVAGSEVALGFWFGGRFLKNGKK